MRNVEFIICHDDNSWKTVVNRVPERQSSSWYANMLLETLKSFHFTGDPLPVFVTVFNESAGQ